MGPVVIVPLMFARWPIFPDVATESSKDAHPDESKMTDKRAKLKFFIGLMENINPTIFHAPRISRSAPSRTVQSSGVNLSQNDRQIVAKIASNVVEGRSAAEALASSGW